MMHDKYSGEPTPACEICRTATTISSMVQGKCPTCNRRMRQMRGSDMTEEEIRESLKKAAERELRA